MRNWIKRYNELITNSNGYSVKSCMYFWACVVTILTYLVIAFCLVFDTLTNGYIKTDMVQLSALVASLAASPAVLGAIKTIGEKSLNNK